MTVTSSSSAAAKQGNFFARRHDVQSATRQRVIANLAIAIYLGLLGLYLLAMEVWDWHLESSTATTVALVIWSIAFVIMAVASSLPRMVKELRHMGDSPNYEDDEWRWLVPARKYFFYPGGYLAFIAAAILVETSGGLVQSPITPVLFALVLSAQQFGRFTLNSWIAIGAGVLAAAVLVGYETQIGVPAAQTAPVELAFAIMALSFVVTALVTHLAKAKNYRASGTCPEPTGAEIHRCKTGHWHYTVHGRQSRGEAILNCPADTSLDQAKQSVQAIVARLGGGDIEWQEDGPTEASGPTRRR